MVNPKYICISAAVGFVLSFVIGLFSGVAFLHLIIRALIYAAVFALLSIAISYLSRTFLVPEPSLDSQQNDENQSSSKKQSGNFVNIVVDDSTLRDDSSAPKFSVTNPNLFGDDVLSESKKTNDSKSFDTKVQSSASSDANKDASPKNDLNSNVKQSVEPKSSNIKNKAASSLSGKKSEKNGQNGFVSADLSSLTSTSLSKSGSSENESDKTENKNTTSPSSSEDIVSHYENQNDNEIDDLPDIGGLDISSSSSNDDIIEDTDFASEGASPSSVAASDNGGQNVDTMAQAIRTMLAKDNE